jgi:hypothetical protein
MRALYESPTIRSESLLADTRYSETAQIPATRARSPVLEVGRQRDFRLISNIIGPENMLARVPQDHRDREGAGAGKADSIFS